MQATEQVSYVTAQEGLALLKDAGISLSKNTYYAGLGSGEIPSVRVGRKYFVRADIVSQMGSQD